MPSPTKDNGDGDGDDVQEKEKKKKKTTTMDESHNTRRLEELVHNLEQTKIELKKKGENFIPMRGRSDDGKSGGG